MEADLHLTDTQYLLALTLFFISYAIFEASTASIVSSPPLELTWSHLGSFQRHFKASTAVYMVVYPHVPVGHYDGTLKI